MGKCFNKQEISEDYSPVLNDLSIEEILETVGKLERDVSR